EGNGNDSHDDDQGCDPDSGHGVEEVGEGNELGGQPTERHYDYSQSDESKHESVFAVKLGEHLRNGGEASASQPSGKDGDDEQTDDHEKLVPEDRHPPGIGDSYVGDENASADGGRVLGESDDVEREVAAADDPGVVGFGPLADIERDQCADADDDDSGRRDENCGPNVHDELRSKR